MKITKLYTGKDNESHFEDIELTLTDAEYGKLAEPLNVQQLFYGEIIEPYEITWHNAPCRQYIIMLEGAIEVEVGDKSKRTFQVGDILLAEDTNGQGHITRAVTDGVRKYLAIPLS